MPPALDGLAVLLTRPAEQVSAWAAAVARAGGTPVVYPTIEVRPPPSWDALDECLERIGDYDWFLFTSATAVRFTLGRLDASGLDVLRSRRIAAVGPETARALETRGLPVTVTPQDARQEGLLAELGALGPGTRVLFPQAIGGREELRNELARRGCIVDVVPASQTVPVQPLPPLPVFDVATFASPSALRAFVAGQGAGSLTSKLVAVLGPTTFAAARTLGIDAIMASAPNADALVQVIAANRNGAA